MKKHGSLNLLNHAFVGPVDFPVKVRISGEWKSSVTTVFVDTQLWKTKNPRKRQNFHQSSVLSTYRIEIYLLQPAIMIKRRSEG